MNRWLPCFCILSFLTSCATIMNRKSTKIEIHTLPGPAKLLLSSDSVVTTPVILQVPRSYDDFKVEFLYDTIHKTVRFKSKIAPQVWGNLVFMFYSPVGVIVDVYSKKKIFTYKKDILVDFTVQPPKIRQWFPDLKGKVFLTIKIPGLNYLKLDTGSKTGNFNMISGLILGVDYYYRKRSYISAEIGSAGTFHPGNPLFSRKIYDSSGRTIPDTVEEATSLILKISNNLDFKYASIGYGINLTDYLYSKTITDSLGHTTAAGKTTNYLSLGCNVSASFRLFQFLTLGFTYAPSLFNLSAGRYEYSHVIYLDAGLRLQLGKHRKDRIKLIKYQPYYLEKQDR